MTNKPDDFVVRLKFSTYSKHLDDKFALIDVLKEIIKIAEATIKTVEEDK